MPRLAAALLALVIPFAVAAVGGCTSTAEAPEGGPPRLPDLDFADLGEGVHNLQEYRGKVVLLNVWASWCEPCKEELPTLERLARARRSEGLEVVGVSIDAHRAEGQVRTVVKAHRLTYPILLDPASRIVQTLKVSGYPTTFLFGRDGALRWRRDGLIPEGDEALATALNEALAAGT
ncbi:MAG: TlpA disulfide reductase family protein [Nannocystaceae bacterium]